MNYLSGALRFVAGTEIEPQNIVPRLIDRIKTSALPHDRRSAIIQLTDVAKESPQRQGNVGEQSLKILYAILEQDSDYDETIKAAIELLIALCGTLEYPTTISDDKTPISRDQFERETKDAAATNIDMYLGLPNSLPLLLQLLDRDNFYIKFGTIELLAAMAANSRHTLQAAVLEAPQGVARICDILEDPHRHIRSNAVLLISTLCDRSPEICKIVVFGAVLEKLFALIESVSSTHHPKSEQAADDQTANQNGYENDDDEDSVESAIIIQDSLVAIRTLINGTSSTSTFFRDSGCVPRLVSCLRQTVNDAAISRNDSSLTANSQETGVRSAIERQSRKNLVIAMQCISGLVHGSDDAARLVKNDFANAEMLKVLSSIAFCITSDEPLGSANSTNKLLQIRITALKTMSQLLRGHDTFRSNFSSALAVPGQPSTINGQITTLRLMLSDPSAAVRVAAYLVLRDSFVVDTKLNLPSSALLNAMTNSTNTASYSLSDNRNLSHGSLPSSTDIPTATDTVSFVVETLKEALIGWPTNSDSAGVFYSASFTSWILANAANAKEQLLNTYANGSPLLPQLIRFLGKLERENGPGEVRIALFCLICVWLNNCPAAVSSFLSSAMHLPMLVDILKSDAGHGETVEVHVRGLAAVLLGICFKATEKTIDPLDNSGFLSGGGGGSVVIPKGVVADVIRTRIGVTLFTSCLDDLRATRAYSSRNSLWKITDDLIGREECEGYLSAGGLLGHQNWYEPLVIEVVDDVYKHIGAKAIDLVAEPTIIEQPNAGTNGYMPTNESGLPKESKVFTDSARDEILQSHKEYIRSQDERLDAARGQIEELAAALREAQVQLDANAQVASTVTSSDAYRQLKAERDELNQEKEALESLLSEKTSDYEEALRTLAAYEEEQSSHVDSFNPGSDISQAEIQNLRSQNAAMTKALDSEMQRSMESSRQIAELEDALHRKEIEIDALSKETESIKSNVHPDVADVLQWRSRAEIAETTLRNQEETMRKIQEAESDLQSRLHVVERSRDNVLAELESVKKLANDHKAEYEKLRLTRQRELDASRDSSATNAAAHDEIEFLKAQLQEAQQKIVEQERQLSSQPPNNDASMDRLQVDYDAVLRSYEAGKVELADCKQALGQWQKRAEVSEDIRDKQATENNRLTNICRELEDSVRTLTVSLKKQEQLATTSKIRVSELEQQCTELEEVRRRTEETLQETKKEAKVRTEQSIRLAGQVYETEEEKARLEEELESFKDRTQTVTHNVHHAGSETLFNDVGIKEELGALKEELRVTNEALIESREKEASILEQMESNSDAISRAEAAESELVSCRAELQKLDEEINELKERLLLLDEAEHAKRALTMQVVELQRTLEEQTAAQARDVDQTDHQSSLVTERNVSKTSLDQKTTELEAASSALKTCRNELSASRRIVADLEKQVAENEAVLSVLRSERDGFLNEATELKEKVDHFTTKEEEYGQLMEIKNQLEESEQRRSELSRELKLAIDEREENIAALQSVIDGRVGEIQMLTADLKVAMEKQGQLKERTEATERKINDSQLMIDEKSEDIAVREEQLVESSRKLQEASDLNVELQRQIDVKTAEIQHNQEEAERLRNELKEMKSKHERTDEQCAEFEQRNAQIFQELNEKIEEIANLDGELESKNMEIELLKAQIIESQRKQEEDADAMVIAKQKCNDLETAVASKTMEVELLKGEVSESEKTRDESKLNAGAFEQRCQQYESAIEEKTLEIELLKAEKWEVEKKRNEFGQNAYSFEQKCKDLEGLVETKSMEMELLKAELKESEKKGTELFESFATAEARCKEYEDRVANKSAQVAALQDQISEAEKRIEESATKLTSMTVAQELAEIESKVLQSKVDSLEVQCAQLTKTLASSQGDAKLRAKEWRDSTEAQVLALRDLRSRLQSSDEKCKSLEERIEELKSLNESEEESEKLVQDQQLRSAVVENVVGSIISNASCSATVKSLSLELDQTKRQLDVTRLSLSHQQHRGDQLAQKLSSMSPETQRDEAQLVSFDNNEIENATGMQQTPQQQQHRITELENALRDAARTVAATNKELIAAQGLLVEISSDKTAMRAELSNAEQQIERLSSQLNSQGSSRSITCSDKQNDLSDCSEVSESEANAMDAALNDDDDYTREVVETDLKTAQVNVMNLKTALSRSITEADSASLLVSDIVEKVGTLEDMMRVSQKNELELGKQLSEIQQSSETERQKLEKEISSAKFSYDDLSKKHTKAQQEIRLLNVSISGLEEKIVDLRQGRQRLSSRVDDLLAQLDISKEDLEEQENKSKRLQHERDELESRYNEFKTKFSLSDQNRVELESRLSETMNQMKLDQQKHERELSQKHEQWDRDAKGYELEIERVSTELEEAERGKRSIETELKSEQALFRKERADLSEEVRVNTAAVKSWTDTANGYAAQVQLLSSELEKQSKSHADEMRDATSIQQGLKAELKTLEAVRDRVQASLRNSESEVLKLKAQLRDESEKRHILEEENQDFVKSTEWLEQRCKGLDEEVKTLKRSTDQLSRMNASLEDKLNAEVDSVRQLRTQIDAKQNDLVSENDRRKRAEEEVSVLTKKLGSKIEEGEALARDNGDLRAWVNDLEKQASELQTAASDFEEVEQSLQESMEAQRASADQVTKLNEDLRKEREALRLSEVRGRKAERERETSAEALSTCEEKLRAVEGRLSEIRESSVEKLSASEASVRSQAQRCAELETSLAQAQRQLAELGHVSDEAFAVKSDLRRTRDEVSRLKQRCDEAESKVESLDEELTKCRDEMAQLRECAGAEGLKSLEAEHNELLVYLADLELELTTLKESAGADLES